MVGLASARIIFGLGLQSSITWPLIRLISVCVPSVKPDQAFPSQNPLHLDIRLGTLTVVSKVSCARILRCLDRKEREDSSIITQASSNNSIVVLLSLQIA